MYEVIFFSLIPVFVTFELLQIISPVNFKNTNIFLFFNRMYAIWGFIGLYFNFWVSLWLIIVSLGVGFYNGYTKVFDTDIQKYIRNKRMFAFWTIVILVYSLYNFFRFNL
jgi:hypothetical protein